VKNQRMNEEEGWTREKRIFFFSWKIFI